MLEVLRQRRASLWQEMLLAAGMLCLFLGIIIGAALLLGWVVMNLPAAIVEAEIAAYRAVTGLQNPQFTRFVFTFFNDPGLDYSIPIALCLGYVWVRRRDDMVGAAAAVALTLVVGASTSQYTHWFGLRPRPFLLLPEAPIDEEWRQIWGVLPSFPSGHMRELTGLCVVLGYFWPGARWAALLYGGFVAFTRVYLGAHFPSDVLGGIVLGLLSGTFGVTAAHLGRRVILSLAEVRQLRTAYAYLSGGEKEDRGSSALMLAKTLRSVSALALLVAATFALGSLVYIENPRILADYLRNTDASLVYPLLRRFDPASARLVFWLFADWTKTYPALIALLLGYSAWRQRRGLGRVALAAAIALVMVQVLAWVFASQFGRPRPISTGEVPLPEVWQSYWSAPGVLPDAYLAGMMALCWLLGRLWGQARLAAHAYPLLAALALLYFGAIWPTDLVATLLVGYWVARCALLWVGQIPGHFLGEGR